MCREPFLSSSWLCVNGRGRLAIPNGDTGPAYSPLLSPAGNLLRLRLDTAQALDRIPIVVFRGAAGTPRIARAEFRDIGQVMGMGVAESRREGIVEEEFQHHQATAEAGPQVDQDRLGAAPQDDLVEGVVDIPEGPVLALLRALDRRRRHLEFLE